jgi:hypothetical protein
VSIERMRIRSKGEMFWFTGLESRSKGARNLGEQIPQAKETERWNRMEMVCQYEVGTTMTTVEMCE